MENLQGIQALGNLINQFPTETHSQECYALAFLLYQKKQYLEALPLFRVLTSNAPSELKYWKGLGSCLQMLNEYEAAIECYAAALGLAGLNKNLSLYIHTADCYLGLNKISEALLTLKPAEKIAKANKDLSALNHIQFLKQRWSENISTNTALKKAKEAS